MQVSLFAEQLLHMKPHINAMGFFGVGKHLFPSVCVLMHFLIMYWKSNIFCFSEIPAADRNNVDLLPYSRAVSFSRKVVTKRQ